MKAIEIKRQTVISGKVVAPGIYRIGREVSKASAVQLIAAQKAVEYVEPDPDPPAPDTDSEKEKAPAGSAEAGNREDNPAQAPKTSILLAKPSGEAVS